MNTLAVRERLFEKIQELLPFFLQHVLFSSEKLGLKNFEMCRSLLLTQAFRKEKSGKKEPLMRKGGFCGNLLSHSTQPLGDVTVSALAVLLAFRTDSNSPFLL